MDDAKFRKPHGTRGRRPDGLIRGKAYVVKNFAREKSIFKNKAGEFVYKLLAIYEDIGITFHTYMPVEYDNYDDSKMEGLLAEVKEGEVKIVFYGKISSSNELKILKKGETVDNDKLEAIQQIEESERSYSSKRKSCDHQEEPSKYPKTD